MILFGASGHGKVILDILQLNKINVSTVWDDNPSDADLMGVPIWQSSESMPLNCEAIISIGNNQIRKDIANKYSDWKFRIAVHPSAIVSENSEIGNGTVIMANAVINPSVVTGKHCIINTASVIEHDCVLADFVHISPNAALAGNVEVGEGTHIGIGATVIQGIKIGKWCTIGAGAVIIRDVPDGCTVVGNPGRIIKNEKKI